LSADAAQDEIADPLRLRQSRRQGKPRAHRIAQQVGALDLQMIHQRKNVAHHVGAPIGRSVMRLAAFAMAAQVQRHEAHAPPLQRAKPAHAPPVLIPVRGEAVHQHNRPPAGADIVISNGKIAGLKLRHGVPKKRSQFLFGGFCRQGKLRPIGEGELPPYFPSGSMGDLPMKMRVLMGAAFALCIAATANAQPKTTGPAPQLPGPRIASPLAPKAVSPAPGVPAEPAHELTASDLGAWLDGFVPYAIARADIAGAEVVVVKDGAVLFEKGYGVSDVKTQAPVD